MAQQERLDLHVSALSRTSGVVACMKDEGPFVLEWVAYHRVLGFDRIFVITNDCSDGTDAILDRLQELGHVTHIVNPMHPGLGPQASGMKELFSRGDVQALDWLLHIDADEFLNISIGGGTLDDLFPVIDHADAVALLWRPFGNNGVERWEGGLVIETFDRTQGVPRTTNAGHKTLFRPARFGSATDHMPKEPKDPETVLVNALGTSLRADALYERNTSRFRLSRDALTWNNACINHYAIRSLDSFLLKNDRGNGMGYDSRKYYRNSNFFRRNNKNGMQDLGIQRHLSAVKQELQLYLDDPVLGPLQDQALDTFRRRRDHVLTPENLAAWEIPRQSAPRDSTGADGVVESSDPPDTPTGFLAQLCGDTLPARIVDVGANPINTPPYDDLLKAGHAEVWGFEPQPDAYEALLQSKSAQEHHFPFAVGDRSEIDLRVYRNSGFTSMFDVRKASIEYLDRFRGHTKELDRLAIPCRRLDEIEELPKADILKIDAQGAELEVIASGRNCLSEAVVIIPEVRFYPIYEDEPSFAELDTELRAQGFMLHKFQTARAVWLNTSQAKKLKGPQNLNQLLDGDAVYIRSLDEPDAASDRQLLILALLADSVFQSYDLAVRCLDLLVLRDAIAQQDVERYGDLVAARQGAF